MSVHAKKGVGSLLPRSDSQIKGTALDGLHQ